MTKRADFNAEEWSAVVEGPLLAGLRVIAAGRGGTIRESLAVGQAYAEARRQQGASELLDERERLALVEAKATPEEVEAYKRFVVTVAEAAANAHREGGFLGVGGEQVSEGERAALDEIAATLGVQGG
jgi:hypothetical protein